MQRLAPRGFRTINGNCNTHTLRHKVAGPIAGEKCPQASDHKVTISTFGKAHQRGRPISNRRQFVTRAPMEIAKAAASILCSLSMPKLEPSAQAIKLRISVNRVNSKRPASRCARERSASERE